MRVSPAPTQVTAPLWASTASFLSEELDKTISAAPSDPHVQRFYAVKVKWCACHVGTQMTTLRKKDVMFAEWKGNWRSEERESGGRGLMGTSFQEAEAGLDGHVTSQLPKGETSPPREPRGGVQIPSLL